MLAEAFPRARHLDPRYLAWDYAENPAGRAIAFDALEAGRPIAHLGARALRARLAGRSERGLLIHHAATLPEARGRGLFTALGDAILRAGAEAGFGFVLAVPNGRSVALFERRLGFQYLGTLDVRVGLASAAPDRRPAPPLALEPEWDAAGVAWRVRRPGSAYRARRSGGSCRLHARAAPGVWLEVAELPEALVPADVPELATWSPLRAWIGLDPARRSGWQLPVPVRLRPAPLHLVFRDLGEGARRLHARRIRLCAFDFDAF